MVSLAEDIAAIEAQLGNTNEALNRVLALAKKEAAKKKATCHPQEPHKAKGLCERCYAVSRARLKGVEPRKEREPGTCPHPERPRHCRGLCKNCYNHDITRGRIPKLENKTEYIAEEMDFLGLTVDEACQRFGVRKDHLTESLTKINRLDLIEKLG